MGENLLKDHVTTDGISAVPALTRILEAARSAGAGGETSLRSGNVTANGFIQFTSPFKPETATEPHTRHDLNSSNTVGGPDRGRLLLEALTTKNIPVLKIGRPMVSPDEQQPAADESTRVSYERAKSLLELKPEMETVAALH